MVDKAIREGHSATVLKHLPRSVIALLDEDLRVVLAEGAALDDRAPGFLPGGGLADLVPAARLADALRCARQALAGMTTTFEYRDPEGTRTWSVDIGPYRPEGSAVDGVVWVARDVSAERKVDDQLPESALRDALTGLSNRQLFMDRLEHALTRLGATGSSLAVLFIDLDRLKSVNDSLGHAAGDDVIVQAARRIRRVVRPTDTVARFGGDEFVVLCEDVGGSVGAERVARRIAAVMARPLVVDETRLRLSASIGVKTCSDPRETASGIVGDADAAMYRAKKHGRGRLEAFDDTMRMRTQDLVRVETGLRRALVEEQFEVLYQPQVRLGDYTIVGAEALLRWVQPDGTRTDPGGFLPVAEETGLIEPIGDWVIEHVCRDAATWPEGMIASINLSAQELADPSLDDRVLAFVDAAGIEPGRLRFEVSETSLFTEAERGAAAVATLRRHGFGIAIDDFGVGFSSLYHLRQVPDIDVLKLDRAFVAELEDSPRDSAIVASVILLTNALRIEALGEGVETAEQAEYLRVLGCDYAQGFWFGRPEPVADFMARLVKEPQTPPPPASIR